MHNIRLKVAYDGTAYFGWQKTLEGPSVEEAMQIILERILQHKVTLQSASRTDSGVHAEGQIVNFLTEKTDLDLERLCISLNQLLPRDIAVLTCEEVLPAFHPTLDAKGKFYHYYICMGHFQLPHHRFYSWHCHYPLDLIAMEQGAKLLVGHHDYSAFCNQKKNHQTSDFQREVSSIAIERIENDRLRIIISGRSFLYQMVRNLVGTLVYIGRYKIAVEQLPEILARGDRTLAGVSAPAHGLFLHHVFY